MRTISGRVSILLICVLVGIMLSVQYKASESYGPNPRTTRVEELSEEVTKLKEENQALAEEIVSLRTKLTNVNNENQSIADLRDELKKANMAAGLTPVTGAGIIVTLNDSLHVLQPGEDPNAYLIHDNDLLSIVNELKVSGAEAISVNGQRLTAMSEIRCAGTTILVNMNKIGPPFEIKAIGNPQLLEGGLAINGGKLEELKLFGLQTNMTKQDNIDIPAYTGPLKFHFASPTPSN